MALYINGRPVNPLASLLVSAVVLAGVIGLGILLLPLIGGILLFILLCVVAIALYGVYYRWRYGDPLKKMQEAAIKEMQRRAQGQTGQETQSTFEENSPTVKKGQVRTGVRRTTTVEDVAVVQEIRRRDSQD